MTTYMHICLDIYFHICTYASSTNRTQTKTLLVYVGICILIYACIYAYMTTYMHIGLDMYLYTCMYAPIYACIYAYITTYMHICLHRYYIYAYMHPSMPRRTGRSPIARKKLIRGQLQRRQHNFATDAYALEVRPQKNLTPASKTMRAMHRPLFLFPRGMY